MSERETHRQTDRQRVGGEGEGGTMEVGVGKEVSTMAQRSQKFLPFDNDPF